MSCWRSELSRVSFCRISSCSLRCISSTRLMSNSMDNTPSVWAPLASDESCLQLEVERHAMAMCVLWGVVGSLEVERTVNSVLRPALRYSIDVPRGIHFSAWKPEATLFENFENPFWDPILLRSK